MFGEIPDYSSNSTVYWTGSQLLSDGAEESKQASTEATERIPTKDLVERRRNRDKGVDLKQMFIRSKLQSFNESNGV